MKKIERLLITLLVFLFFLSCSNIQSINKKTVKKEPRKECAPRRRGIETRHLVSAARIKSSVLASCFKNYLKFEKEKEQYMSTCNQIVVKKYGKVSFVQITNTNKKALPKGFKMCVEQEYWKMNFRGLQLSRTHMIKFKMNFSSLASAR